MQKELECLQAQPPYDIVATFKAPSLEIGLKYEQGVGDTDGDVAMGKTSKDITMQSTNKIYSII